MSRKLPTMVCRSLETEFKPFGFKFIISEQSFIRRTDQRTEDFQLVITKDRPGFRVCPCVGVRFEQVEEIFHRNSEFEPKYHLGTSTMGINLWNVYGEEGYELPLKEESDVPGVVSRLVTIFHEKAEPYFSQFSTLQAVDAAINDRPHEKCIHRGMPIDRCSTGLIVAKLTGRKNYDELVSIYHDRLQKLENGFYLKWFDPLVADLAKMHPEVCVR